ncbi:MAG TPA: TPM domain-containing protein [Mycobacteriales bacterium]|nr:TPM domain-containing protein [Mycobacteriales bacterium]
MPSLRVRAGLAAVVAAALGVLPVPAAHASGFPAPTGYFVDATGDISAADGRAIEAELESYAERSGHQLAVAVVDTTGNESIEDYSNDLFGDWGVGSAERNDGVLIVVAIDDRQLRIEVGRGLEETLTDIEADDIIRNDMVPSLKAGDYAAAVRAGERGVRAALGDPTPNAAGQPQGFSGYGGGQPGSRTSDTGMPETIAIVIFLLFLLVMVMAVTSAFRRGGRGGRSPIFMGTGWGAGSWSGGGGGGFSGGGGFGGFGGGSSGGGGASGSW